MNTSAAYDRYSDMLLEQRQQMPPEPEQIESRAEEIMQNFKNDSDEQIVAKINEFLGGYVDADIYNQFITDACYSQARYEFNATKNIGLFSRCADY